MSSMRKDRKHRVAASLLFGEVGGANLLQISKLEWADRAPVDWRRLDALYMKARAGGVTNATIDSFEAAGIFNAISAPVIAVTPGRAAQILRYYSSLIDGVSTDQTPGEVAKSALRRSMELDPTPSR
jgi:hypothetical protein